MAAWLHVGAGVEEVADDDELQCNGRLAVRVKFMNDIAIGDFLFGSGNLRQDIIATVICRLEESKQSVQGAASSSHPGQAHDLLHGAVAMLRPLSGAEECLGDQERPELASWQVNVLRVFILNHLAAPLKMEDLAAITALTPNQFGKRFNNMFGVTPMRFLKLVRIELAKRLLEKTQVPLDKVAQRCGFSGLNYFSRVFREEAGMSARRWRICGQI